MDPLRYFYGEEIRSLQLNTGWLLVKYIDLFQCLTILWQKINKSVEPKDRLFIQMVEDIEDPVFSDPWKSIKNWDTIMHPFFDDGSTMQAYEISMMTAQTKRAIDDEVNSLLLVKGSNKRRENGNNKVLCVLKLIIS